MPIKTKGFAHLLYAELFRFWEYETEKRCVNCGELLGKIDPKTHKMVITGEGFYSIHKGCKNPYESLSTSAQDNAAKPQEDSEDE